MEAALARSFTIFAIVLARLLPARLARPVFEAGAATCDRPCLTLLPASQGRGQAGNRIEDAGIVHNVALVAATTNRLRP